MTDLLERLIAARAEVATLAGLPAQRVCTDKVLARLVLMEPRSSAEVQACVRGGGAGDFAGAAAEVFRIHFSGLGFWREVGSQDADARVCEAYTRGMPIGDLLLTEGIELEQLLASLRARVEAGGWVPRRGLLEALEVPLEVGAGVAAWMQGRGEPVDLEEARAAFAGEVGPRDVEIIALLVAIERRWKAAKPVFVREGVEAVAVAPPAEASASEPAPWVGGTGWTEAEDQRLWAGLREGHRPAAMAEALGRGLAEVWLRMERLEFGGSGRRVEEADAPWTPAQDARLWRSVVAGLPMVEVGLELRRWPSEVRRRFQWLELVDANGGALLAFEDTPWTPEQTARLRTLLERGASAFEMALALQRSTAAIVATLQGEADGALRHEVELEVALAGVSGNSPRFVLQAFADHGGFHSGDHLCRVLGVSSSRGQATLSSVTEQLRRRVGDSHFQLWTSTGRAGGLTMRPLLLAVLRRAMGRRKSPEGVAVPSWLAQGGPRLAELPASAELSVLAAEPAELGPPSPDELLWRRYIAGDPLESIAAALGRTPSELHARFDVLEMIDANGGRPLAHAGQRWSREEEDTIADLFYDGAALTTLALAVQRPRLEVARQLEALELDCDEAPTLEARQDLLASALQTVRSASARRVLRLIASESPPYDLGALGGSGAQEELQAILDELNDALSRVTNVVAFQLLAQSDHDGTWTLELAALGTLRRALGAEVPHDSIRPWVGLPDLPWPEATDATDAVLDGVAPVELGQALSSVVDPDQRAILEQFVENIRFESAEELAELMGVEVEVAEAGMSALQAVLREALGCPDFALWEEEDGELVLVEAYREAVERGLEG